MGHAKAFSLAASYIIGVILGALAVYINNHMSSQPTPDEMMGAKLVGVMCHREEQQNENLNEDSCLGFCEDTFRSKKSEGLCKNGYITEELVRMTKE